MIIKGLQKTTLLDFPGKLAATVFTAGCNFRCPFCHNASLVVRPNEVEEVSLDHFFSYLEKRSSLLDGVCITGGEPLINPDIADFIARIRSYGLLVKLDTNGAFPKRLEALLDAGLIDYVAMDVKNSEIKYADTVGRENFDISPVKESIEIIMNKAPDYEFRTTVVRELHEPSDIEEICKWLTGAKRYFLQKYVDSGDILCGSFSAYSDPEMLELHSLACRYIPSAILRGV